MEIQNTTVQNNYYFNSNSTDADIPDFSEMSADEIIRALAERSNGPDGVGDEATATGIADAAGKALVEYISDRLEADDSIPQAKKDEINQIMESVEQANGLDSPEELADMLTALKDKYKEIMKEIMAEETQETVEGTGGEAGGAEGKGDGKGGPAEAGNWMVTLAKAMSSLAGKHLKKMIETQHELAALERNAPVPPGENATDKEREDYAKAQGEHAAQFTEKTAEMQAHTQMFKMAQEMTTTVLKSLGEALNSTVRKQ